MTNAWETKATTEEEKGGAAKEGEEMQLGAQEIQAAESAPAKEQRRSYRDLVLSYGRRKTLMGKDLDDGEVSDDDLIEKSPDGTWVGIGTTRE